MFLSGFDFISLIILVHLIYHSSLENNQFIILALSPSNWGCSASRECKLSNPPQLARPHTECISHTDTNTQTQTHIFAHTNTYMFV